VKRRLPLALMLLLGAAIAHADPPVLVRPMAVKWSGQAPLLTFSARDFVNKSVIEKLDSGLPQRIVTRVYAYPEGGGEPISVSVVSCRVTYDLWETVYRVQEQTATADHTRTLSDRASVIAACLDVRALALGDMDAFARFRGRSIYFAAIIELNPVSPDTVQRIRRWIAKPDGSQAHGDAFFGSFVSIFVSRRMGSAERTLAFRSASYDVPP
jgi:hypothetical protein